MQVMQRSLPKVTQLRQGWESWDLNSSYLNPELGLPMEELRPQSTTGLRIWALTEITLVTFLELVSSSWMMMAPPSSNLRRLNRARYENIRPGVCTCACLSSKLSCNLQQAPYGIYSSNWGTKWEVVSAVTGHRRPHSLMVKSMTFCIRHGIKFSLSCSNRRFTKVDRQMGNEHMKRCSTSLVLQTVQNTTMVRYH